MNRLLYYFLKLAAKVPMSWLNIFALKISFFLRLFGYRKKVIVENLKNAFPKKSPKEIRQITNKFYLHLGQVFAEIIKTFGMNKKNAQKHVAIMNKDVITKPLSEGKDVIMVFGHYGNWEWSILGIPFNIEAEIVGIYKKLNSTFWNEKFKDVRGKFGATLLSMNECVRYLFKKGEKPRLIAILADQTPSINELNHWTTFLNQDTPVFLGAEKISKKLDCPLVFAKLERIKNGYYNLNLDLITDNPNNFKEGDLTNLHTQILEQQIIKKPEQWLWSHKRWKHIRK